MCAAYAIYVLFRHISGIDPFLATKDVDALAFITDEETLTPIEEFSPEMQESIPKTAWAFGLEEDWLNAGATILLERGLPEGLANRSSKHTKKYGPCLTVQFIDRMDQVALKLHAAMDPVKGRRTRRIWSR